MKKKAIVLHSGGIDSSLCLALAAKQLASSEIVSVSFNYGQRHIQEIVQAEKIAKIWNIDHVVLAIDCFESITKSALIGTSTQITKDHCGVANTLVTGRNGLFARLGAIYADYLGASCIYLGVSEGEGKENGYRDCSREYMDLKQQILRIDLDNPAFEIRTPLVYMNKRQILEKAKQEGILDFLLKETITCYEGIPNMGCKQCPSCRIRNQALDEMFTHCL